MKKFLPLIALAAASSLMISGCGRNEKPASAGQPAAVENPAEAPGEPPPVPAAEPVEAPEPVDRAQALGFARYIPADAEVLVSLHQAGELLADMRKMKIWNTMDSELARPFLADDGEEQEIDGGGEFQDLDGMLEEDDMFDMPAMLSGEDFFGSEVTFAFGPDSAGRAAAFLDFYRRSTYQQMRAMAAAMGAEGNPGDPEALIGGFGLMTSMFSDIYGELLNDRTAIAALESFKMPSIYFAVRATGENLAAAHDMVSGPIQILSLFGEAVAPAEVEQAGATFRGFRLIGSDIAGLMEEGREFMEESLGREATRVLFDFINRQEIVAVSGTIGDYAVAFLGSSIEDFKLASTPEESIATSPALGFVDAQLTHPLHAVLYSAKGFSESISSSMVGLADYAGGLGDGFATNDRDGRNRDLVALLQLVAERERAVRAMTTHETTGITLVADNGLRIDTFGGASGMLDFQAPSRLAALADAPDTAVFLNMTTDPAYRDRAIAYQEAVFQAAHALMMRMMGSAANGMEAVDPGEFVFDPFSELRGVAAMVESDFRPHLINLWQAIAHDMRSGLGSEMAVVVDLKGTMPEIPGVPVVFPKDTGAPRIAMLSPVSNREALSGSWQSIEESATQVVGRIAEMNGNDIPIPKPIHSESGDFTNWFLPLPWFDNDFLPSVTLNDDWFAMGTSRDQAVDLLGRIDSLDARPGGGLHVMVNFGMIADFLRIETARFAADREQVIAAGTMSAEEFDERVAAMEAMAEAVGEFDRLDIRCWQEAGVTRSRTHLRTIQ